MRSQLVTFSLTWEEGLDTIIITGLLGKEKASLEQYTDSDILHVLISRSVLNQKRKT